MVAQQEITKTLTFAHSPDPDDAYMFYGFAEGAVKIPGYDVKHHLEDIQSLNERAQRGEFEITAVSAHAYAHLTDRYWALSCGASVGRKYGPMLVAQQPSKDFKFRSGRVAIPGKWTTAALVLDLWLAENGRPVPQSKYLIDGTAPTIEDSIGGRGRHVERIVMPFDQILDAVEKGIVDAGLIIHEGQLTYQTQGLHKLWDAGEWWHAKTGLPLPLGLDVVRADLGLPLAQQISQALRDSIEYANAHQEGALAYALQFGRGLDTALAKRFIGMYVNEDTLQQGQEVQEGLKKLYELAYQGNFIPKNPVLRFV